MQPARPVGNGEHQAAPDSACHGASPRAVEDSATPREEETEGDEEGGGIVVDNTIVCVGCRCERWRTAATPRPGPGWGRGVRVRAWEEGYFPVVLVLDLVSVAAPVLVLDLGST